MKKKIFILSVLASTLAWAQETPKNQPKEKTIEEVTIKKTKKAVEHKPDRTIFDFSEQSNLNTGTALEGIKKLPGLMSSDLTGMTYQGKPLAVYMDSQPLNITSTDLSAFLEGLPGSAIEKIEVITNPGAEFPATGGGAIMNILTSRSAKSYLTATYSGNYSFSNEDKTRHKTNQSILLNSKNKWFGWQLNTGANYRESTQMLATDDLTKFNSEERDRGYFARMALSFDLGKDKLILNYNINHNNDDDAPLSVGRISGLNYQRKDETEAKRWRHKAVVTYQKRFDAPDKRLNFVASYNQVKRDFRQDNVYNFLNSLPLSVSPYITSFEARTAEFKLNYSQDLAILDGGKLRIGGLYERMDYDTEGNGIKNLDYQRSTYATFAEAQATKGKWDLTLGVRAEGYDISGISYNHILAKYDDLQGFKKYRFFPNASVQYNFSPMVNMAVNYNHKINLPSISQLNPNSTFNNGSFYNAGNANIQPTLFHNFGVKVSAMNYLFVSYDLGLVDNDIQEKMTRTGDVVSIINQNISSVKTHSFSMGMPLPLAIFTKPLKEIMQSNPDKMSFFYLVGAYQLQDIPNFNNKGLWYFNVNGQIILPKEVKLELNYTLIPAGTEYYYYRINKPLQNTLNLTLSRKFMKNRLNVSFFANDVFNANKVDARTKQMPLIRFNVKPDSRTFGISVNYKIPTKNRLAKENQNMLLESQNEEKGGLIK